MMRPIAGSFAQHEKARVVAKLRAPRETFGQTRVSAGPQELERDLRVERLARQLHRKAGASKVSSRDRARLPR